MQHTRLVTTFSNVSGASFVGIDTLTQVKLLGGKGNPQQGRITKSMVGASVIVFQNKNINGYAAMISRRLTKEGKNPGSFVLGVRTWGVRIPDMPIVQHEKDGQVKYYLEVIFLQPGVVEYLLDGAPINEANIVGLPADREGKQGGLDDKVVIRTFAADSIVEVRIDGKVFN